MGTDLLCLRKLVEHWELRYDWRAAETALNRWSHFRAVVHGVPLHFLLARGAGSRPIPLLLSHGAFSSFHEFHKVIGPLSDPGRHGSAPEDSFDVVVWSLPGFGFSGRPDGPGTNILRIAELAHGLMTEVLGYEKFGAGGGSWGGLVSSCLADVYADSILGLHLTQASPPAGSASRVGVEPTEDEARLAATLRDYVREEAGYQRLLSTRPESIGFALSDSPAGLAGWFVEKIRAWSDCESGDYDVEDLLTLLSLTWFTRSAASSQRLYYEAAHEDWSLPASSKIGVPTGVLGLPRGLPNELAPAEMIGRTFDLRRYRMAERGGHYPALDIPDILVDELRAFFRPLRAESST